VEFAPLGSSLPLRLRLLSIRSTVEMSHRDFSAIDASLRLGRDAASGTLARAGAGLRQPSAGEWEAVIEFAARRRIVRRRLNEAQVLVQGDTERRHFMKRQPGVDTLKWSAAWRLFSAAAVLALLVPGLHAQEFRGAFGGVVTDPTGAVIAGAKVVVLETSTNTRVESATDTVGHYSIPFLLPGDYNLTVKHAGFKEYERKAIHLSAGETPAIDVRLDVGEASQTVEVVADAPLINSENASIGQTILAQEVQDLPSNGGTPMTVLTFAMGVTPMSQPSQVMPYASGGGSSWAIAGSPNQTNELLVDGVPNATWDGRQAYSPPKDAVSEVRVKAFDTDAAYGHTGGGTANQMLKSGTNRLTGTVSWNNQPNNLVANDFFRNKSGLPVTLTHFNQYGASVGGPVYMPKIVNGRDRLFWFFAFEGIQDSQPATTFMTVPTPEELTGDFSRLLTTNTKTVLYDPNSAVLNGTTVTRTAFPGNKIPTSQFSPIAKNYLGFFPAPNVPNLTRDDGYNNFGANATSKDGYTNELGRLDYNINSRNRTYFNVRHTDYSQVKNDYYGNISTGSLLSRSNWGSSLDHVFMVNTTNVVNVRVNFTRMYEDHSSPSQSVDPVSMGFPAYLKANSQYVQMPTMTFASGTTGLQALGFGSNANKLPSQSWQLYGSWSMIRGKHNMKFGGDARQYRLNYAAMGNSTGNFSFSANNWVRASSSASSTVTMGQDLAEFLLGMPTSGTYDINSSAMYYAYYASGFVQDDWRLSRNLTLNLGLRFDHDFPYHEKWGRAVDGFAWDAMSPLAAAAQAAYAKAPNALLPASAFNVRGGLTFAGPTNTAIYENTSHLFSPRVGLAWTPDHFHNKLAVRSGIAMFVTPIAISTLQPTGAYSTNPLGLQTGYSQTTSMTVSNNTYLSPAATLADPFPGGAIQQPAGPTAGLATFAGQGITFMNPEMKSPYSVRWNLSIQYQVSSSTVVEAAYIGNHSVHLPITYTQFNSLPAQYLSTLPFRDQTVINQLTATTPNPFYGLQTSTATNTTITVAQLLSRYPQFATGATSPGSSGVVMNDNSAGSSRYNSFNLRVQRRFARGVSVMANYMKSKQIDSNSWLNGSDLSPETRISPFFRPQRVAIAASYEVPVGRGRRYQMQSRLLDTLIGGWQISSTYNFQIGGPLTWMNGSTNNPGDYLYYGSSLNSDPRNTDQAFDITKFDKTSANQFQYHIRTFPTTFPNLRSDGINNWDGSLLKRVNLGERRYVQIRMETFNLINHPTFAGANTTATNSAFGTITAMANRSRMVQFVGRLVF
jgi:hypothetical protein